MAGLSFPGGTPKEEMHKHIRIHLMVKDCIGNYMSKDETLRYLQTRYQFTRKDIKKAWSALERNNPDYFILHNERTRERNLRTCERVASSSPREGTSAIQGEQEQQRLSPPLAYPNDFWQQLLNTLDQIQSKTQQLSTLRKIQSDTDQMVKLLTDGHEFGPHPSAAEGSSKRQRLGENEKTGGDGETEKLQKKEEGNNEEAAEE